MGSNCKFQGIVGVDVVAGDGGDDDDDASWLVLVGSSSF